MKSEETTYQHHMRVLHFLFQYSIWRWQVRSCQACLDLPKVTQDLLDRTRNLRFNSYPKGFDFQTPSFPFQISALLGLAFLGITLKCLCFRSCRMLLFKILLKSHFHYFALQYHYSVYTNTLKILLNSFFVWKHILQCNSRLFLKILKGFKIP